MNGEAIIKRELELYKKSEDKGKSRWRYGYIDGLEFALKVLENERRGKTEVTERASGGLD